MFHLEKHIITSTDTAIDQQKQLNLLDAARRLDLFGKIIHCIHSFFCRFDILINGEPASHDIHLHIQQYSAEFMFMYTVFGVVPARIKRDMFVPVSFSLGRIVLEFRCEKIHPIWKPDNTTIDQKGVEHVVYEGKFLPTLRVMRDDLVNSPRIKFISPILPILHKQIRYEAIQKLRLKSLVSYESRYYMQRVRTEGKTNVNRGMYRGSPFFSEELTEPHAIPERRLDAEFYKEFKAGIKRDSLDLFNTLGWRENVGKSNSTLQNLIYNKGVADRTKILGDVWTFFLTRSMGDGNSSHTVTFTPKKRKIYPY